MPLPTLEAEIEQEPDRMATYDLSSLSALSLVTNMLTNPVTITAMFN